MQRTALSFLLAFALIAGTVPSATASSLPVGTTAVPLATITNDRDASVSRMQLMLTGDGDVSGISMQTSANAGSDPAATKTQIYPLAGIESTDGVVLGQGQGVKAIFLKGTIAAAEGRGSLTIRYLNNGVFRHWSECKIGLERVGPHDWQLINAYDGHAIQTIKVETWALGISTLANVCPAATA
ncbi:MAG TPA: hypothetical protein VFS86_01345 [Rhodanobacteraceae bacterium]|jgi:hypothetical protein|nr:hypothetical protein [Rhodanobacteraceae bacterium]